MPQSFPPEKAMVSSSLYPALNIMYLIDPFDLHTSKPHLLPIADALVSGASCLPQAQTRSTVPSR